MSIIDALDSFHENAVRLTCSGEENCILRMDGFQNYRILKGELLCEEPSEMCDCLVFISETSEDLVIAVVEFKSNNPHVSKVTRQIENGTKKAASILEDCKKVCLSDELKCLEKKKLCLIAVARRWDSTSRKMLKHRKIISEGRDYPIHAKECGDSLKDIL